MKFVGCRRISNKDKKSRIKVGTVDQFPRSFRACYVSFSFLLPRFKLCLIQKRSTNGFSRNRTEHVRSSHSSWTNARASRSNSRHSRISPPRVKSLIHFPSRLPFSTLLSRKKTGRRRGVIVAITIIIFCGLKKKKKKKEKTTRVFRTSTGIIQVGSTRHNYAPTEWLSFFKPFTQHSCAPAKLHFPAAAPTTGAVAAQHPASRPTAIHGERAIHVRSSSARSYIFYQASCNYFV